MSADCKSCDPALWRPDSWHKHHAGQQPAYPDQHEVNQITSQLQKLPPLVAAEDVDALREQLAQVALGKAFLLQGGDCAESFADFSQQHVMQLARVLLQMSATLVHSTKKPVIKLCRAAGQFAKPRSCDTETRNGQTLPSYRGDLINDVAFAAQARRPDPNRLLRGYFQSAATLNYLRHLAASGFAALKNVAAWNFEFIEHTAYGQRFGHIVQAIEQAIAFVEACGLTDAHRHLRTTELYTSHEALILPYEEGLTRFVPDKNGYYALSAHMIWIGERTRNLDGAHVAFASGVRNPVGVKIGPTAKADDVLRLVDTLNPDNQPGRLVLIARMGADKAPDVLPALVKAVKEHGSHVVWSCDPMHGNTTVTNDGYKTRDFGAIFSEVKTFFEVHRAWGTYPGGVHLEMTGQNVTECTGGTVPVREGDLPLRYATLCDPRLNAMQSLELALSLSEEIVQAAA